MIYGKERPGKSTAEEIEIVDFLHAESVAPQEWWRVLQHVVETTC
jgi:hypothetical protein